MVSVVTPPEIARTTFARAEFVNRHPVMTLLETVLRPIRIAADRNAMGVSRARDVDKTPIVETKCVVPTVAALRRPVMMV